MTVKYTPALQGMFVDAESITQHPRNPKNGDVEEIVRSLHANGCYRPIYVSRATRNIVAGHHLYLSLLTLGENNVPVQWIDDLTMDDELRIVLADNKVAELGRMDDGLVVDILNDIGIDGTGYSYEELEDMKADLATGFKGGEAEDQMQDSLGDYGRDVTCPNCSHQFEVSLEVLS